MIPSLQDIIAGVKAGTYTEAQALAWVDQHIANAVAAGANRDVFAAAALQGLLAAGTPYPTAQAMSEQCWGYADAMLAGRDAS